MLDRPHDAFDDGALMLRGDLKDLLEAVLRDLRDKPEELPANLRVIGKVRLYHPKSLLEDPLD